jgi:hypothetical protein
MRLYAICLVKNEADVIAQSIRYALTFCERIYVLDNGRTDGTWEEVCRLAQNDARIVAFGQTFDKFNNDLRGRVYEAVHKDLSDDDWWMILDADEFMAEDPRPVIEQADYVGADFINAWQAQFYFTDDDLRLWEAGEESRDRPITERRRFYRIDHKEPRIFKNRLQGGWNDSALLKRKKKSRYCVINRHYPLRDPPQITSRLAVRYGQPEFATQVRTLDFKEKVRTSKGLILRHEGEPWQFTFVGLYLFRKHWLRMVRRRLQQDGFIRSLSATVAFRRFSVGRHRGERQ